MSDPKVEISDRDAVMVIGVFASLSGPLLAEVLDEALAAQLRDWLAQQGILQADATQRELSFALLELVERVRHARSEYEAPSDGATFEMRLAGTGW